MRWLSLAAELECLSSVSDSSVYVACDGYRQQLDYRVGAQALSDTDLRHASSAAAAQQHGLLGLNTADASYPSPR